MSAPECALETRETHKVIVTHVIGSDPFGGFILGPYVALGNSPVVVPRDSNPAHGLTIVPKSTSARIGMEGKSWVSPRQAPSDHLEGCERAIDPSRL